MEIKYLGHSSFLVKGKKAQVVFDPFDSHQVGLPFPKIEADVVCISHDHPDHNFQIGISGDPYVIKGPGEYEIKGVNVSGIPSFHDDCGGALRGVNTIYVVEMDGLFLAHLGDLGHSLTDRQMSVMGNVDILFVPIGGHYTIDAKTAVKVVSEIEPKMIIPMHFRVPGLKSTFDVLGTLDDFLKEIGESPALEKSLKISRDDLPEGSVSLVVLENSVAP